MHHPSFNSIYIVVDTPPDESNIEPVPVSGSDSVDNESHLQQPDSTADQADSNVSPPITEQEPENNDDVVDPEVSHDVDSGSMHSESVDMEIEGDDDSDQSVFSNSNGNLHQNGNGDVAQFRETLANLSQQLEIDRLAFLHKKLEENGTKVPSLNEIASDIKGDKLINNISDSDIYSKRPKARMAGWISGLSFGISKRAKKFSK